MSVERRGDNNFSTVQRRGEKKTVLPNRDYTKPKPVHTEMDASSMQEPSKDSRSKAIELYGAKATAANFDTKAFEERVRQRIAYYEANPKEKKEFLKKFEGWIGKAIFAFIIMIAIPPLAGIVIAFGLFYLFLMSLKPKDPNRVRKIQQIAEDIAVAVKLKQVK